MDKSHRMIRGLVILWFVICWSGVSQQCMALDVTSSEGFTLWHRNAQLAARAYEMDTQMTKPGFVQGLSVDIAQTLSASAVYYFVVTDHPAKVHTVVVRGTANVDNAWLDMQFKLVTDPLLGIAVHQGFAVAASEIYQRVVATLKKDYIIVTTGHSLGGAVALLLAMHFDVNDYPIRRVITFGQPKVTNVSGAKQFAHLDVVRFVTAADLVPIVPPLDVWDLASLNIYWHLGREIVLFPGQYYAELKGLKSMLRGLAVLKKIPDKTNFHAHRMTEYLQRMEEKLIQRQRIPFEERAQYLGSVQK